MQESFQLAHETLYLSVAITDLFMARRDVKREEMQLLGATAILLASKFYVSFRFFRLKNPPQFLGIIIQSYYSNN